jgi:hypothetical protein
MHIASNTNNLLYRNNLGVLSIVATEHVSTCNDHRKSLHLITVGLANFTASCGNKINVHFKLKVASVCEH